MGNFDVKHKIFSLFLEKNCTKFPLPKGTVWSTTPKGPYKESSTIKEDNEDKIKNRKDLKKIKTQILAIEKTLKRLNRKLAETQEFLNSPELYNDSSKMNLHDLLRDQVNLDAEIKSTEEEWLELNEELENS